MSRAVRRGVGARETLEVLNPFLEILRSPGLISIPRDTLKGALGHFLSTLEGDRLNAYVEDVLNSPSLWRDLGARGVEEAVRPAPTVKVRALRPELKDGWFARDKLGKASRAWIEQIVAAAKKTKSDKSIYFFTGLLKGLDDEPEIKWGRSRVDMEEEVVVALSDRLDKGEKTTAKRPTAGEQSPLESYCEAAGHIDAARLRVLDLKAVVPRLQRRLFEDLGYMPPGEQWQRMHLNQAKTLAKGLSRTIVALSEGDDAEQVFAWETATAFVARMLLCARGFQEEWSKPMKPAVGGIEWERQQAALATCVEVFWPTVEIMLEPHSYAKRRERVKLASNIVLTLSKFTFITQADGGTPEGYERVLYGSLDIIAAEGGPESVRQLFLDLNQRVVSNSLAGFILVVAEQLIRLMDAETIANIAFPLAEKYVVRPQHRASFEAAHAFLLALLDTSSESLEYDGSQAPFVEALVVIVAHALLRESRDAAVKPEQLGAAYPIVVRSAARRSVALVERCIKMLDDARFPNKAYGLAVRKIRVAIASSLPAPMVPEYLEQTVAPIVLASPKESEERLELSGLAFNVVMQDMPDESKQAAIDWWLRWRRRFEGGTDAPQARL